MDNQTIWNIALQQSAYDCSCAPEDFLAKENRVFESFADNRARHYLQLPHICTLVSYGTNIVASGRADLLGEIGAYLNRFPDIAHCFETPGLYSLNRILEKAEAAVCFMSDNFSRMWMQYLVPAIAVRMNFGYWRQTILGICICRNGKMHCVQIGKRWTGWQWGLLKRAD